MVRLRPTVTTSGEVRSIAYAQQTSEKREVVELICISGVRLLIQQSIMSCRIDVTYQDDCPDPSGRRKLKRLIAEVIDDDEARPEQDHVE